MNFSFSTNAEYFLPKIMNGEVESKPVNKGWCMYEYEDVRPCRKHNFECEKGCNFFVPDEEGRERISDAIKDHLNQIDVSVHLIKEIIRDRKTIKEFEIKLNTEVTKVRSFAEENSKILREHSIMEGYYE